MPVIKVSPGVIYRVISWGCIEGGFTSLKHLSIHTDVILGSLDMIVVCVPPMWIVGGGKQGSALSGW